jgi:hypothetical protein
MQVLESNGAFQHLHGNLVCINDLQLAKQFVLQEASGITSAA